MNSVLGKGRDHDTMDYARRKRYIEWAKSSRTALAQAQDEGHRRLAKKLETARYDRLIARLDHWITNDPSLSDHQSIRADHVQIYSQARLRHWRTEISREGRHLRALRRKQLHRPAQKQTETPPAGRKGTPARAARAHGHLIGPGGRTLAFLTHVNAVLGSD